MNVQISEYKDYLNFKVRPNNNFCGECGLELKSTDNFGLCGGCFREAMQDEGYGYSDREFEADVAQSLQDQEDSFGGVDW